jgi:hypothetical protein
MSAEKVFSRKEWGSLSIQDRIRAMNDNLDHVEAKSATKSFAPSPRTSLEDGVFIPSSDANIFNIVAANDVTQKQRPSVVDLWRKQLTPKSQTPSSRNSPGCRPKSEHHAFNFQQQHQSEFQFKEKQEDVNSRADPIPCTTESRTKNGLKRRQTPTNDNANFFGEFDKVGYNARRNSMDSRRDGRLISCNNRQPSWVSTTQKERPSWGAPRYLMQPKVPPHLLTLPKSTKPNEFGIAKTLSKPRSSSLDARSSSSFITSRETQRAPTSARILTESPRRESPLENWQRQNLPKPTTPVVSLTTKATVAVARYHSGTPSPVRQATKHSPRWGKPQERAPVVPPSFVPILPVDASISRPIISQRASTLVKTVPIDRPKAERRVDDGATTEPSTEQSLLSISCTRTQRKPSVLDRWPLRSNKSINSTVSVHHPRKKVNNDKIVPPSFRSVSVASNGVGKADANAVTLRASVRTGWRQKKNHIVQVAAPLRTVLPAGAEKGNKTDSFWIVPWVKKDNNKGVEVPQSLLASKCNTKNTWHNTLTNVNVSTEAGDPSKDDAFLKQSASRYIAGLQRNLVPSTLSQFSESDNSAAKVYRKPSAKGWNSRADSMLASAEHRSNASAPAARPSSKAHDFLQNKKYSYFGKIYQARRLAKDKTQQESLAPTPKASSNKNSPLEALQNRTATSDLLYTKKVQPVLFTELDLNEALQLSFDSEPHHAHSNFAKECDNVRITLTMNESDENVPAMPCVAIQASNHLRPSALKSIMPKRSPNITSIDTNMEDLNTQVGESAQLSTSPAVVQLSQSSAFGTYKPKLSMSIIHKVNRRPEISSPSAIDQACARTEEMKEQRTTAVPVNASGGDPTSTLSSNSHVNSASEKNASVKSLKTQSFLEKVESKSNPAHAHGDDVARMYLPSPVVRKSKAPASKRNLTIETSMRNVLAPTPETAAPEGTTSISRGAVEITKLLHAENQCKKSLLTVVQTQGDIVRRQETGGISRRDCVPRKTVVSPRMASILSPDRSEGKFSFLSDSLKMSNSMVSTYPSTLSSPAERALQERQRKDKEVITTSNNNTQQTPFKEPQTPQLAEASSLNAEEMKSLSAGAMASQARTPLDRPADRTLLIGTSRNSPQWQGVQSSPQWPGTQHPPTLPSSRTYTPKAELFTSPMRSTKSGRDSFETSPRLYVRYNTADRFIEPGSNPSSPNQPPIVAQEKERTVQVSCESESFESSFLSRGTVTTMDSAYRRQITNQAAHRHLSSQKKSTIKNMGPHLKRSRMAPGMIASPSESIVSEKFVAENDANIKELESACQGFSMRQVVGDLSGELKFLGFHKLASKVNEKLRLGGATLRTYLKGNRGDCQSLVDIQNQCPDMKSFNPFDNSEDVAIEVEYMDDGIDTDGEETSYEDRDDQDNCAPIDDAIQQRLSENPKPLLGFTGQTRGTPRSVPRLGDRDEEECLTRHSCDAKSARV